MSPLARALEFSRRLAVGAFCCLLQTTCVTQPGGSAEPRAVPERPAPALSLSPLTLSFLGLNDLHGRLSALPAFAGYANNVRAARKRDDGALALVDAGDLFQGTLESNLSEGAAVLDAYAALGMTAAALGNHEFDFGPLGQTLQGDPQGAIRARIREASFPFLSANLVVRGSHESPEWDKLGRTALVTIGGVRVGFVGLLTRETPSIVMKSWFAGLDVEPLLETLLIEARKLRESGAEVVILLAHAGADCKDLSEPTDFRSCSPQAEIFDLARALPARTVDAIFAGHTHAGVRHVVNGIPIVEAYSRGRAFARIDLRLDRRTHRVLEAQVYPPHDLCPTTEGIACTLSDYEGLPVLPDTGVARAIAPALARADEQRRAPLGCSVSEKLSGAHDRESPLGNLFADLLREAVPGADVAILNGGTLRADLPEGELRYGSLFEAMPFDNLVARIRLTGAELRRVLAAHLEHAAHGLISLSGLSVDAHCGRKGLELLLTRNDGRIVTDHETLLLATSDYLATGGDDLLVPLGLDPKRIEIDESTLFRDALAQSLKHHPRISPRDPATFDVNHPRLVLPGTRPIVCAH